MPYYPTFKQTGTHCTLSLLGPSGGGGGVAF